MEIRKFKYAKADGTIANREVLVVREAVIKGKRYIEGVDLLAIRNDSLRDSIRAAAPDTYLDHDGAIKTPNEREFDVKAALKHWRKFDAAKIVG
jgi:hypothetical protein